MKKKYIFLSAMLVVAFSINSYGQSWYLSSPSVNTFTKGDIGIGTTAYPSDARLHIYGDVGILEHGVEIGDNIPEIKINRTESLAVGVNIFEIWKGLPVGATPGLIDVINQNGYLGILQPKPTEPLDVNGKALIENDLAVQNNVSIGSSTYPDDAKLLVNSDDGLSGVVSVPEIKVIRSNGSAGITSSGLSNYFEIWHQDTRHTAGHPTPSPVLIDVINQNGYLGILQPNPSQALDVAGNALIEKNLTVDANATIDGNATVDQILTVNNYAVIGIPSSGTPLPIPSGYSLYVANGILAEKVKVELSTDPWSDFVFNKGYNLMPLNQVESFVKTNKHLPEVPSADEVAKDGIDVGSMDAKLLQKIEELTLYVIQQQKAIEEQKNEIELLKKKLY